jgi:Spy/CpxP family protein refolding chaperone
MKSSIIISVFALVFGLMASMNAQMPSGMAHDSTHWEGSHHGMMNEDMKIYHMDKGMQQDRMHSHNRMKMTPLAQMMPYIETVKGLPDMQKELSLSDDQVSKLVDLQAAYIKQNADLKADLTKKDLKLKSLLQSNAAGTEINLQLKSCAATQIDIGVAAYETANKMKALLNDAQKKKLMEKMEKHEYDHYNPIKKE